MTTGNAENAEAIYKTRRGDQPELAEVALRNICDYAHILPEYEQEIRRQIKAVLATERQRLSAKEELHHVALEVLERRHQEELAAERSREKTFEGAFEAVSKAEFEIRQELATERQRRKQAEVAMNAAKRSDDERLIAEVRKPLVEVLSHARPIVFNAILTPDSSPWQVDVRTKVLKLIDDALAKAKEGK